MRGLAAKRETRGYVGMIYRQIYDVSPDDQRFVMLRRIIDNDAQQLVVVENFFEELKAKVGNYQRAPTGTPTAQNSTPLPVIQRLTQL